MKEEELEKAAKAYAELLIPESSFPGKSAKNELIRLNIIADFKAGAKWMEEVQKQNGKSK